MTSLLVELNGVDLHVVIDARGAISGVLADPKTKKFLSGDVFESALGGLGKAIASLQSSSPDAATMLKPIVDAAGSLVSHLDASSIPLGQYAKAVSDGAGMVATFVGTLQSDPASALGRLVSADQLTKAVEAITSGYSHGGDDPIGRFHALIERIDGGVPSDPAQFARLAVDALLPFGGSGLATMRGGLDAILSASGAISLPQGRMSGLLLALDAVEAAAMNPQQLAQALATLETVRKSTVQVLTEDVATVRNAIASLRIAERLAPIATVAATIRGGEDGFLEILDRWRGMLLEARDQVEHFDVTQIRDFLNRLTAFIEEQAQLRIVQPIDDSVILAENFVRGLFSQLPIRSFRAQINAFLESIAKAIRDAHLDAVAKDIHAAIAAIDHALDPATLANEFQALLGAAKPVIAGVINNIKTALGNVVTAINGIQATLKTILTKVVAVLTAFNDAITAITATINSLDVEGATDQTIASIHQLRESATKLLGVAPLPEPLRPIVEQVITTLESIDFNTVFAPIEAVLATVKVPDSAKAQITDALKQVQEKLDNAIPEQLIASIDKEVKDVLDAIRNFDPNKLLAGVQKYLDEAATFLESLKVKDAAETIRGPFQTVLDGIDAVAPRKLLAPVISAYDSLLGSVSLPSISGTLEKLAGTINSFGENATQQILAPMAKLTGAQVNVSSGSGGTGSTSTTSTSTSTSSTTSGGTSIPPNGPEPAPPASPNVKPGDVIRLLGWLPNKLREALAALPATVAGEALREIDSVTAGLARDLRAVRARMLDVAARVEAQLDADLRLVAAAQIRAQLAIHLHSAAGVDVNVSVLAVATVSPGEMRHALGSLLDEVQEHARDAVGAVSGETAVALDQAATALETFRLAGVVTSLDDLLAALDPEPLAADLDAFAAAVLKKVPTLLAEVEDDFVAAFKKIQQLFTELNPATQAQKFLRVVDVLRQELDVLNPAVLADELGMIHLAIRDAVAAYDPRVIAADLDTTLTHVATSLRTLDVNQILGNLNVLGPILAAVEQANPAAVLQAVGTDLKSVGEKIAALNPTALLDAVTTLIPQLEQGLRKAVEAIIAEIVALLESLKFASGSVTVTGQVGS